MVHIFAHGDRAYGIPKIYISYGTLYMYSVKDTFQAVNRIQSFPSELFDQNYHYCW